MSLKALFVASALATTVLAQGGAWEKCGGMDWSGPTTCIPNYRCVFSNSWYSQCLPGIATTSSTAPSTSRSSSSSSSSRTTSTRSTTSASTTTVTSISSVGTTSSTTGSTASSTTSSLTPVATQSALLWATHFSGTVSTLTFSQSGSSYNLSSLSQTTCGTQPGWLTYDDLTKTLYCVDEHWATGSLSAYNVNSAGGLSQIAKVSTPASAVHSTLYGGTSGSSFVAIAHYGSSQINTFALPLTISSKPLQTFKYTMSGSGPVPSRQEAPHPHEALLDPTGAFLLIPDLGADLIRIYSITRSTGLIASCANVTTAPGSGPRHGSFFVPSSGNTAGTVLYMGNEITNSISSYAVSYTSTCLSLALTNTAIPYPNSIPPNTTPGGVKLAGVHVTGNTLLTSNRADNSFGANLDSLATFDLDASTGAFVFREITSSFGSYPRSFAVNKAGTFVAIGNQNSATVAIVRRDPVTGTLGSLAASIRIGVTGVDGNGGLSSVVWKE